MFCFFSFPPAQSAVNASCRVEGFEVSVLRQHTHQPVVMFVLVTLSPNRGHFLCESDCEPTNILVLLDYSLANCHEYVGIWVVKVFNSFLCGRLGVSCFVLLLFLSFSS